MADEWTAKLYGRGDYNVYEVVNRAGVILLSTPGDSNTLIPAGDRKRIAELAAAAPDLYEALLELADALEGAQAANPEASIEFFEELVEIEPGWRMRVKAALLKANPQRKPDAK